MALDGGILAIAIVATITTGIVSVVFIVAIYKCAKVALKMYLQRDGGGNLDRVASGEPGSTSGAGVETDDMEMGMMSYFFEDIQKERPVRFSSQQLRVFTRNYAHKVGSGGFGVVYKGRFPSGAAVAVKVLNSTLGKRAEEQFMAEVGTIGRTYHINLVRLYGFCFDATVKALVYEYMENGSLDRYLFDPPPERKVSFGKLHEIAVGTAKALRYLHEECSQRIIHYDIKPENVLLGGAGLEPKVSDFGLARLCDREDTHLTITGARGTPGYAAPELWMPLLVTHKCDVYRPTATGCCCSRCSGGAGTWSSGCTAGRAKSGIPGGCGTGSRRGRGRRAGACRVDGGLEGEGDGGEGVQGGAVVRTVQAG
ncbi:unnamed protein product [Urochloa humidicola]